MEEQRDEIVVHVDRMVRKKDVPKRLIDQWKPIKMVNAEPERRKVRIEQDQKKEQEAKAKQAKKAKAKLAPEVEKDQDKEFADPELRIDHIVRKVYVENKPRGKKKKHSGWQYKVRFIGYGPRSDEWYWEEDLMRTAPEMVEEFNQTWKEENTKTSK